MTARKNIAASVRQRLRNLARQRGEDFQYLLVRYGLERLLYRISRSEARTRFVLKGAALFSLWTNEPHRATRDIDLLGHGDNSIPHLEQVFRQVCEVEVEEDGLVFLTETVQGQVIGRDDEYEGLRLTLTALLDRARIPLQVDIGFGDAVKPEPITVEYPVLLDLPPPVLRAYSREAVVAEKFQAMVSLGMGNSRMKDFFDLWVITHEFSFDGERLAGAIQATFERRRSPLPQDPPLALTDTFASDPIKQTQWRAFLRRIQPQGQTSPAGLGELCTFLQGFLMPLLRVLGREEVFRAAWPPGGPWRRTGGGY